MITQGVSSGSRRQPVPPAMGNLHPTSGRSPAGTPPFRQRQGLALSSEAGSLENRATVSRTNGSDNEIDINASLRASASTSTCATFAGCGFKVRFNLTPNDTTLFKAPYGNQNRRRLTSRCRPGLVPAEFSRPA